MSYAPPPGPHGGMPRQHQWGTAPPPPQPYRGPAAPRKSLVAIVGLLVIVASVSAMALAVLWWDYSIRKTGYTDTNPYRDLPAPRGLGLSVPGPADLPTGLTGGDA